MSDLARYLGACKGNDDTVCGEAMQWCLDGAVAEANVRASCAIMAHRHCVMDPEYCHRMADQLQAELFEHRREPNKELQVEWNRTHTFRFLACKLLQEPGTGRCEGLGVTLPVSLGNAPRLICERHRELCHEIAGWFQPLEEFPSMALVVRDVRARALEVEYACRFGDAQQCVEQGLRYVSGDGVDADLEIGRVFLEEGCNAGDAWGCSTLADSYDQAASLDERALAVNLYRRACEDGNGAACWKLGRMYLKGDRVDQSPDRAEELFSRACAQGYQAGCAYGKKLAK